MCGLAAGQVRFHATHACAKRLVPAVVGVGGGREQVVPFGRLAALVVEPTVGVFAFFALPRLRHRGGGVNAVWVVFI